MQFQIRSDAKNQTLHFGTNNTPFKEVFGDDPKVKLESNIVSNLLKPLLHAAFIYRKLSSTVSSKTMKTFRSMKKI